MEREKISKADFLKQADRNDLVMIYKVATTGLDPAKDRIIAVAAKLCMKTSGNLFEQVDAVTWYINPGAPLSEKVKEITGITDEYLSGKPTEAEAIMDIAEYFGNTAVCGFNNHGFDDEFMTEAYNRIGATFAPIESVDTLSVASQVITPAEVKDYRMVTLSEKFGFETGKGIEFDTERILSLLNLEIIRARETTEKKSGENLIKVKVRRVSFWEKKYGAKLLSRIYVEGDVQKFWMNTGNCTWEATAHEELCKYDIDDLKKQVYQLTGCSDDKALAGYKSSVTAA